MQVGEMELEDVEVARFLGALRVGLGVAMFLAPRRVLKTWTGEGDGSLPSTVALRGMAVRDIALGGGILLAIENDAPKRGWLEAVALADAGDAVATLVDWRRMGGLRGLFWFAVEAGTALVEAQVAQTIDD
jgi:hypothetical protein